MGKLEQVRAIVASNPANRNWLRLLKTDADALDLMDDVLEGDYDLNSQFGEALVTFRRHFGSYASYAAELSRDRDLGDPYEY